MSIKKPQGRVLVVDDEPGFRSLIQWELIEQGLAVETAENGAVAVEKIKNDRFDVVVTDLSMPLLDGLMLLREIKAMAPDTEVIVMTGFATVDTAVYAMQFGALDVVLKPFKVDRVTSRVAQVVSGVLHKCECRLEKVIKSAGQTHPPI
jgi:DNA-binding NtrC family response regulator